MTSEFDWFADPDIVLREQLAIAVYKNPAHEVVIRQERAWDEDADTFIRVQPDNARRLADAILRAAGEQPPLALPPPRQSRQKPACDVGEAPELALDGGRHG